MSDERFDEDLRAVLLETAPDDVPVALRQRVFAVADEHPRRQQRAGALWRAVLMGAAAAAALAVLVVVVLSRSVPGPEPLPGVGGSPSPSLVPSATPVETPVETPAIGACRAEDLEAQIVSWEGAAGSRLATVQVSNTGARPCLLAAMSSVALVDATGRALLEAERSVSEAPIDLAPGARVRSEVRASNYCGPAAASPISIVLGLANGDSVTAAPAPGEFGDLAVPPCLGEEPGNIEISPWSSP